METSELEKNNFQATVIKNIFPECKKMSQSDQLLTKRKKNELLYCVVQYVQSVFYNTYIVAQKGKESTYEKIL